MKYFDDNKTNIIFTTNNFYVFFDDYNYDNLIVRCYYVVKDNIKEPIGSHFTDNINGNYEQPIFNEKGFAIITKNQNAEYLKINSIFSFDDMRFIDKDSKDLSQIYNLYFNANLEKNKTI